MAVRLNKFRVTTEGSSGLFSDDRRESDKKDTSNIS